MASEPWVSALASANESSVTACAATPPQAPDTSTAVPESFARQHLVKIGLKPVQEPMHDV